MKPFCFPVLLLALATALRAAPAQVPLGTVVATIPAAPAKIVADPTRSQVYVVDTLTNSVLVVDTTTLQVTTTIPAGSNPVDASISGDGQMLYVANGGSTAAAVTVIDLTSLSVHGTVALPGAPSAVAAGAGTRFYVAAVPTVSPQPQDPSPKSYVYQLDAATGAIQVAFDKDPSLNNFLQVTPDGNRLFVANAGLSPGVLSSFDVSAGAPAQLQANQQASQNGEQLVVSHTGKYVCLPSGGGNGSGYNTYLFATFDLTAHYGVLNNGPYPGPLAFSPDDSTVYQNVIATSGNTIQVFSTRTFTKTAEFTFPSMSASGYADVITSPTVDNTGSYLFVGANTTNGGTVASNASRAVVIATGTGTLEPPPLITVARPTTKKNKKGVTQALVSAAGFGFKGTVIGGQGGLRRLTVTLAGYRTANAKVGDTGAWKAVFTGVAPGNYQASVLAVDNAGNKSNKISFRLLVR